MARSLCFLGAGASVPFGIPSMTRMAAGFEEMLRSNYSPTIPLLDEIKSQLRDYPEFDIEALITVLEDIMNCNVTRALTHPSVHYFSAWYNGYDRMVKDRMEGAARNRDTADELMSAVKEFVVDNCSVKNQEFDIYEAFFQKALNTEGYGSTDGLWRESDHRIPYRIFTTNYDPVIEAFCQSRNLEYESGEGRNQILDITSRNEELYRPEPRLFQIYKLHGSINWFKDQNGRWRFQTGAAHTGSRTPLGTEVISELLIYPAKEKYTFREPFYSMFHHLKDCLTTADRCYVVGYSFRDDDILWLFHDAMELNPKLYLSLIDPNARVIVSEKFVDFADRIQLIPQEFSVAACRQLV